MRGGKVRYDEMCPKGVPDDGRTVEMEGEEVVYREMAGVESIEEQVVEAVVPEVQAVVERVQTAVEAQPALPEAVRPLPEVLTTEQAMVYWQRLMAAGFVDDNCQLLPTTNRLQTWYIAEVFAEKLGMKAVKWKLFEDCWGVKNLAQYKLRSQDNGRLPARYDEIDRLFEEEV